MLPFSDISDDDHSTYFLFLDESGDHSLEKIDSQYPVFVLGGALIAAKDYASVDKTFKAMKKKVFGDEGIILHTADLTRNCNGFERMKESEFRGRAFSEINRVMEQMPYQVLGCVVRKEQHLVEYGLSAIDPYHFSLSVVLERAFFAIKKTGKLYLIAESRNATLDRILETAFLELKIAGTSRLPPVELSAIEAELIIRSKKRNVSGLQIADLLVSPMGRYAIGKKMREDWEIIRSKFYKFMEKWDGEGFVVLPK